MRQLIGLFNKPLYQCMTSSSQQIRFKHDRKYSWPSRRKHLMENMNEDPNKGKPKWISKMREVLDAHKDRRLKLATELGPGPAQYKIPEDPIEQELIIKRKERKLEPLHEELPPYEKYTDDEIESFQRMNATYYDPKFNPHLHEERYRVDPDEEPFNAIYTGNEHTEGGQQYTGVKNVTTPELWSYVEQLARIKIAPPVQTRKLGEPAKPLPSGFIPPPEEAPDLPYFVSRTRNHLLPVYYHLDGNQEDCFTFVKFVMGNIWLFEEDLRKHLESLNPAGGRILTHVREPDEQVGFRGRHLQPIVDWLHEKGF